MSQLCQAITLSYGGDMQCPFNHLIVYKGDFVWHIKCIHIWPDASEIAWGHFCWFSGFFGFFDIFWPRFEFLWYVLCSMATNGLKWKAVLHYTTLKIKLCIFRSTFTNFCNEISNCHSLSNTVDSNMTKIESSYFQGSGKYINAPDMSNKIPPIGD